MTESGDETALRCELERAGYEVDRWIYPPGTVFPPHAHEEDKVVCVLAGRFLLTMHGESIVLEAGGRLEVPRGATHRAEVLGAEPVVSLDAVKRR
jgi:quercetin dioxygenase-like cupin family protein